MRRGGRGLGGGTASRSGSAKEAPRRAAPSAEPSFRVRRVRVSLTTGAGERAPEAWKGERARLCPDEPGGRSAAQAPREPARLRHPAGPGPGPQPREREGKPRRTAVVARDEGGSPGCAPSPLYLGLLLGHGGASSRDLSESESARARIPFLLALALPPSSTAREHALRAPQSSAPSWPRRGHVGAHALEARSRAMLSSSGARFRGWRGRRLDVRHRPLKRERLRGKVQGEGAARS